jgi:pteridine reductase
MGHKPRALVTGAARRVGRGIALEMARCGWDVAVHCGRSVDEADEVVREAGAGAFRVSADLGTAQGCAALVHAVNDRWDGLELLVHNASIFEPQPFSEISDASWRRMLAINLDAPFRLSRDLLPLLRAGRPLDGAPEDAKATVVHLCDIGAERPLRGYAHYSVSKAGLVMLVRAMAVELAPEVRAVGVSPGQVAWPDSYDEATRRQLLKRIPMGRVGTPEDVARLVRFLATEGHYLNGVVVPVDGGRSCRL